jgi:RNA polymerase sigma factor for flagellar operon FliA
MASASYAYSPTVNADAARQRDALVLRHLPQVNLIANRIHGRMPSHVCLDDLVSSGVMGLLAAVDHYDPSLNVQLNTYAERKIRGAILDSLRELDWAPRETRKRSRLIEAAIHRASQRAGQDPPEEQIAAELGIGVPEYRKWLADVQSIELEPLESAPGSRPGGDLLNLVSGDPDQLPSRVLERSELCRILALAIERMPKMESTVLSLYYYQDLSLREIAAAVGVHLSRVGQIRAQAILRLRCHLERVWLSQPKRKV